MGVDISTYCCRIGTFRHGPGLDFVLLREDVNYGGSMRAVGAVAFIGILLIMAGVEANPGPLSKSSTADGDKEVEDISIVLKSIGLDKYIPIFEEHMIGVNEVGLMSKEDFHEIGIKQVGIRLRITQACKKHLAAEQVGHGLAEAFATGQPTRTLTDVYPYLPIDPETTAELGGHGYAGTSATGQPTRTLMEETRPLMEENQYLPTNPETIAEQVGYGFAGASATGQPTRTPTEVDQCLPIDPETTDGNSILQHIKDYGMDNIQHVLIESLDEWKNIPLNIAVTGITGVGKSSLINSLRNIHDRHSSAAKVGEKETTNCCTPYSFSSQKNVVVWDLPGVGTPTFPKETYLHDVEFERYDFFLICSATRFTESDQWLAEQIKKRRKSFYFVRTKIDIDMYNAKRRLGSEFDEKTQIESIQCDCLEQLLPDSKIYLISNAERSQYDFPSLLTDLINNIPSEKKAALTLSIFVFSDEILREKETILRNRMWKVALASAVGAVIPIPGLSVMFDVGIILMEILFYREQFGLDDESLSKTADAAKIDVNTLKLAANLKTDESLFTSTGVLSFISSYAAREVTEKLIQWFVPVIGTVIGCGISFSTTMTILMALLEMMRDDANSVLQYVLSRKHSSV